MLNTVFATNIGADYIAPGDLIVISTSYGHDGSLVLCVSRTNTSGTFVTFAELLIVGDLTDLVHTNNTGHPWNNKASLRHVYAHKVGV